MLDQVCREVIFSDFEIGKARRLARIARDLTLRRAFQTSYFFSRRAAEECWRWLGARHFDVIVAGQLYMVPYLYDDVLPRTVLDSHNSETRRVATMASTWSESPKGVVARLQRVPVERYESAVVSALARVVAVSEDDAAVFEPFAPGRVDVVPNGVDCRGLRPRPRLPQEPRVLFIGSLDYGANVDAVRYLIKDILPLVRRAARVTVVGSHPRRAVHRAARWSAGRVEVVGYVPDAQPYWDAARVLAVPIRIGGGTRLKILEALARGVPVVSTARGCEGLGLLDGKDVIIAEGAPAFAEAVERLLDDDDLCARLAAHGRATVEQRYDWRTIGEAFERSLMAAV